MKRSEEHLEERLEEIIKILTEMKPPSSGRASCDPDATEVYIENFKKLTKEKEKPAHKNYDQKLIRVSIEAQRNFLNEHREVLEAEINDFGSTIFHLIVEKPPNKATVELLQELVGKVPEETLKKTTVNGLTALHIAACAGNTEALKVFANKNKSLLSIRDNKGPWLPIHHAALWCRDKTVEYLLPETSSEAFESIDADLLLFLLVNSNLPGLALRLLKTHSHSAEPDKNDYLWERTLNKLATNSLAFNSGRKLGFCESLIYSNIPVNDDDQDVASPPLHNDMEMQSIISIHSKEIVILSQIAATIGALEQKLYAPLWNILIHLVPHIKRIRDQKHMHLQTLELVRRMISKEFWTYNKAIEKLKEPVLKAARLGIHEFVSEVLKAYPDSALFSDPEGRNMFLLAVLHRKENVFNLIHDQVASIKDLPSYIQDKSDNNILHLAGKMLSPPSQVPGAALQMQRELQWFRGIRDLFHPSLQEQQNGKQLTPAELFTEEHETLMKKGEKWMRETATSCSVVGALIITIVFAAAFTVPGGFDPNGVPIYLNNTYFRIFAVSVALALFASTTSVQIFLGMLTSRYAEEDFLKDLPTKLIIGLATLFLSSTSMMVAFGAAFCILLSHPWKWVIILICLLGSLPVTFYAWMQFPLLIDIFGFTYRPSIILKPNKYV